MEANDLIAGTVGVLPQLSVLEMPLHPGSVRVIAISVLLAAGTIEILPIVGSTTGRLTARCQLGRQETSRAGSLPSTR